MSRTSTNRYDEPAYQPACGFDDYPESEEGWRETYAWRLENYLMRAYAAEVQKEEHLFRAFDDTGNEIDQTRRLWNFWRFIVDTDARALTGGGLTLETLDHSAAVRMRGGRAAGQDALLLAGEAVWRRARLATNLPRWGRMACAMGDYFLEAVPLSRREPRRTTIVAYDPRTVTAIYDLATGTELERVEIDSQYLDAPLMTERKGQAPDAAVQTYRRVLTRDRVDVYRNGEPVPAESGDHGLGYVPIVQLRAIPFDQPEHSLPAPGGIERQVMRLDSLATMNHAIGNRSGNPIFATIGFVLGGTGATKVGRLGRFIDGIPKDGDAKFITPDAGLLPHLLEQARELVHQIRDTSPEFLFASDAAQESAEARSLRGQAFEAKMLEMRAGVYDALCTVTAMAVAMDGGPRFDPDNVPFKIDAPPILPRNTTAELDNLIKVKPDIKRADYVRGLQRLGFVDGDEDPETYASEVADETATRATQFFAGDANAGGAGGQGGSDGGAAPGANGGAAA
jgi:hypothetical protein